MAKTFDQTYAESGRQSELDALRKDPAKYDAAKLAYEKGSGLAPTPGISNIKPTGTVADDSGKLYGGWYDNPQTGRNQRYWGNNVWTDGDEPGLPSDSSQVTSYLNNFQNNILNKSLPEIRDMLTPNNREPELLNRKQMFEDYRADYGVSDLEKTLNELKGEEEDLVAMFRQQKAFERGKTVPMNVIEGRISTAERDAQERLDFIGRQKSRVIDELNTKYSIIGQMMNFASLDYQDAVAAYDREFTQNMQIYKLVSDEQNRAQDIARANLQIYMNAITKGNMDYGSLPADQKVMISKLEAQAGLPIGFTSGLKLDPGANVLFTTSNEGVTQVGVRNPDGTISVQSYGTRISSGSGKMSEAEMSRSASAEMSQFLSSNANSYGHIDGSTYIYARKKWVEGTGGSTDQFDQLFRDYRDPYNLGQYKLSYEEQNR
jgi:hypothetical protein